MESKGITEEVKFLSKNNNNNVYIDGDNLVIDKIDNNNIDMIILLSMLASATDEVRFVKIKNSCFTKKTLNRYRKVGFVYVIINGYIVSDLPN